MFNTETTDVVKICLHTKFRLRACSGSLIDLHQTVC